ncbi:MAG: tetratricopeptide repeat protein [Myxococcota bacterium]|nr:tetratricopeptide repeat protein [Myxococcota bacterium]
MQRLYMASKKQSRKKQIAQDTADDQFLVEANKAADWTEKNLKSIVTALGAVAVIVAAVLGFQEMNERSKSEATQKLTKAIVEYREITDLQKVLTSTQPQKLIEDAKKAIPSFEAIIASKEAGAELAKLYAADLEFRAGAHEKAEALYKDYLATAPKDDIIRFVALEGAGYAAEELKNYDIALTYFEQLTKLPQSFYLDYGLKHVARIHELKEDNDKALATYKELLEKVPDTKLKEFVDAKIASLE